MTTQHIQPDIIDTYLVGVGSGSWPTWNSPSGAYVGIVAANDKAINAYTTAPASGSGGSLKVNSTKSGS